MTDNLRDQIYNNMSLKETDELIKIWQRHNSNEWSDVAFEVVGEILRERLGELPEQRFEKHKRTSEFEKEHFPLWCPNCDQQGYIFLDNIDGAYFVTCKTCDWETSQVSCPKCQMGGEFVRNIGKRPSSWVCPECKTKYELPLGFYETSITLFTEDVLPHTVLEQIKDDFHSANNLWRILQSMIIGLLAVAVLMIAGLLPMVLAFTPLPWTIPGFIMTLLIFAAWWWLMGRVLKIIRERFAERRSLNAKTRPT